MSRRIPLGVASIALGVVFVLRPFITLALLVGLTALVLIAAAYALVAPNGVRSHARHSRTPDRPAPLRGVGTHVPRWAKESRTAHLTAGFLCAALAVGAVARPHLTYATLAYLPLVGLLAYGVYALGRFAFTARTHPRGARGLPPHPLLYGPAAVLAAFAGWRWPDVVLMLLAAGTGAVLVVSGVRMLHRGPSPDRPRWRRAATAAVLPGAVGAMVLSGYLGSHPAPDDFYSSEEAALAAEPGTLLRAEAHPAPAGARAQRILYATLAADRTPAVASAVVYTPADAQHAPVVGWAHSTTGIAPECAPSAAGIETGQMHVLPEILNAGWALVAPDLTGLDPEDPHPHLIGTGEGYRIIDALRAADDTGLPLGQETVLWGHSHGGHGALWAGGIWKDHAPDRSLLGVAAFAPAANLPAIFDSWAQSRFRNAHSAYALSAYAGEYDDVDTREYVRPGASATGAAYASKCLQSPGSAVTLTASLLQETSMVKREGVQGPLRERARENIPALDLGAPLLLLQGERDTVIAPEPQEEYAADRCEAGWAVDYRTYPGLDHLPLLAPGSPAIDDAFLWTATLFSGAPVPPATC